MKKTKKKTRFRPDPAAAEVGRRIRRLLKRKGLTQLDLADRMKIAQSNVSLFLSGRRGVTVRTLAKVAEALGCRLDVRFVSEV